MPYCFLKYRFEGENEGWRPDCPDSVSVLLLADARPGRWSLFHYVDEGPGTWSPEHPASRSLVDLIISGERYPPALALARKETTKVLTGHEPTPDDIQRVYGTALQHHLSRQTEARYVLAMALDGDGIDLCKGEWFWIVAADSTAVEWVSADYFIYGSPKAKFDLTDVQLKHLSMERIEVWSGFGAGD